MLTGPNNIVLAGFSYGSFVVTGALQHVAGQVKQLVYIDDFTPDNDETVLDPIRGMERVNIELGEEWLVS